MMTETEGFFSRSGIGTELLETTSWGHSGNHLENPSTFQQNCVSALFFENMSFKIASLRIKLILNQNIY